MSVEEPTTSEPQYLRSAQGWFPFRAMSSHLLVFSVSPAIYSLVSDIYGQFQFVKVYSSLCQSIPVYYSLYCVFQSTPFWATPAYYSLLQPTQCYSSILQHITAYYSLFQPSPAYSSLFQPSLADLCFILPIYAYYSLVHAVPSSSSLF